jgi:hypothetical protein
MGYWIDFRQPWSDLSTLLNGKTGIRGIVNQKKVSFLKKMAGIFKGSSHHYYRRKSAVQTGGKAMQRG